MSGWPTMGQDRIAAQIAAMTPEQRQHLITTMPQQVGNTDGVPWEMRIAANRINIADAILDERRTVDRPEDAKIRSVVDRRYGAAAGSGRRGTGAGGDFLRSGETRRGDRRA